MNQTIFDISDTARHAWYSLPEVGRIVVAALLIAGITTAAILCGTRE